MFKRRKGVSEPGHARPGIGSGWVAFMPSQLHADDTLAAALDAAAGDAVETVDLEQMKPRGFAAERVAIALYPSMQELTTIADQINRARDKHGDGTPVLVIGLRPGQLTEFGGWLAQRAAADTLQGVRLAVSDHPQDIVAAVVDKQAPVTQTNVVAMPLSTEVETGKFKYFYCISPQLRSMLAYLGELASNNIERIYLLGGPGSGKTSLAYYFYLCRQRGNFVTVNLTSESTDDKAAMKSLLCGHVSGAFPGAGARTGAFAHARDGVCFLDESHGVSGSVMEVLMEALDSGQYLPYGASAKQPLNSAVVFASNRTWDTLIASINLDEHARLGAMVMHLHDLAARREDLIAVLAVTLHRMREKSTSWAAVTGVDASAWEEMTSCPWRGNTRALIRVAETAYVEAATHGDTVINAAQVRQAMQLWEPAEHASHALYSSSSQTESDV